MRRNLWVLLMLVIFSCSDKQKSSTERSKQDSTEIPSADIPETRETLNPNPVVSFVERTDNPLNEWYFSVKLYETKKTFHYLMKVQFEEIKGNDTLRLPNFGIPPKPVLRKGKEQYSCIVGFLDKDSTFREYKKVHVKNNSLKITALRHYAVTTRERVKN